MVTRADASSRVTAATVRELQCSLAALGRPDIATWLVADVSLGAWRGHQVATELCRQLALPPPGHSWPPLTTRSAGRPSFADLIGHGIDTEARGEVSVLVALDAAERVSAALDSATPHAVVVLAPRFGVPWEPEDHLFVQLLADRLAGHTVVAVAHTEARRADDDIAPHEPVALVPGVIDPDLGAALGPPPDLVTDEVTVALPNSFRFVAPEHRQRPEDVPRLRYDQLTAISTGCPWVHAYAQFYGNNFFVDSTFLVSQAWERFAEGGGGAALRLLGRAEDCARGPDSRSIAQCQAQGMRIAMSRFGEIAEVADPSPAVPRPLRGFLWLAKAYGLVMNGDIDRAWPVVDAAREIFDGAPDERELLYLLNIAALGRLKQGDPAEALVLEREIESRLPADDWRLRYVNMINIARLERRSASHDASHRAYSAAFALTFGSRFEGEAVYTNACVARVDAARGDDEAALLGWVRAALHWVAAAMPIALTGRVVRAVTGAPVAARLDLDEQVSTALLRELTVAAGVCGLSVDDGPERRPAPVPVFLRADAPQLPRLDAAVGGAGWSVLVSSRADVAAYPARPASRELRRALLALLVTLGDAPQLAQADALVIDDRLGQEIPQTPYELLESAVRLGVGTVSTAGGPPLVLDPGTSRRLTGALRVGLGPAVSRIERTPLGAIAQFVRGGTEIVPDRIAAALDFAADRSVDDLGSLAQLRRLEAHHVLYLTCSEATCAAAGISWPSRTNSPVTSLR